jgi:glutathione S-transferase
MAELIPAFVTLLALGFYFYTGLLVGQARSKYKVPAPATTGDPTFERTLRAQLNTAEWMPLFLPALWLFAFYVDPVVGGALGVIWVLGRMMFVSGYIAEASKRSQGFLVQFVAWTILFLGAFIGLVWKAAGWAPLLTQPLL